MSQRPVHDLPEQLDLPLRTGEPWWYWLGGRPALDLVNTVRERWRRRVETLVTPDDLALWLAQAGVLGHAEAAAAIVTDDLLAQARDLREAIDACVQATVDETPFDPAAVGHIDGWLRHAGARPRLALAPDGVAVLGEHAEEGHAARRALGEIALDAARMIGAPDQRVRVRVCASETCSARFYDRSPAGRRRWCSMRTCGNEAKARRHRAKAQDAA